MTEDAATAAGVSSPFFPVAPSRWRCESAPDRGKEQLSAAPKSPIASGVKMDFADPKCPAARQQRKHQQPLP